jgi:hypothetical protein
MNIRIAGTVNLEQGFLDKLLNELNIHSGPMNFKVEQNPLDYTTENYDWDSFFDACSNYRIDNSFENDDYFVVVTELRNKNNWFGTHSKNQINTLFVTASDWENYIYCNPCYPVAYEIISSIWSAVSLEQTNISPYHPETRGCINDMCGKKSDISLKFRTADICDPCYILFSMIKDEDFMEQSVKILEHLRVKMLNRNQE